MQTNNVYTEQQEEFATILKVQNLTKNYPNFTLDKVSFEIPQGVIVGFVGQNGAGKSTTLKCIMRTTLADDGKVFVFGKDMSQSELQCKQDIAFTTGAFEYYRGETLQKIAKVYSTFYQNWDNGIFQKYCQKFKLILSKKVKELSAGMKVKFALALAMSHNAKLFIFDEPTSGLDPIAREELLDVFRDIVADGDKSILFSTHITSDLEKCTDYVLFIANGKILINEEKDKLLESYAFITGGKDLLTADLQQRAVAIKQNAFGFTGLILRANILPTDKFSTQKPSLDDIIIYLNLEAQQC